MVSGGRICQTSEAGETNNSGKTTIFGLTTMRDKTPRDKTPIDVLRSLRLTCQLVILHPWFRNGSRLPQAKPCEPTDVHDIEQLVFELSVITELVCRHGQQADTHRDAYLHLLGQIVTTLISPMVESKLIDMIERSDRIGIYQELARLRRLVIDSAQAGNTDNRQIA